MESNPGRILSIDYGSKRVGIAISDPSRMIAQGVTTLTNDDDLIGEIVTIANVREATVVLVGMPYDHEGAKGRKAVEVDAFIVRLKAALNLPVETWDESYSSVLAQQIFRETGMKKKKRQQKARVDEMAARLLLQEYLDHLATKNA